MREDSIVETILPDGREAVVYELLFDRARIVVGQPGSGSVDDQW